MRPSRVLLGALVVLGGAYVYLAAFHPPQRAREHPYFDAPRPWVVAHRGGMALAPENTMAAFRQAEALGVDVLEMDLRITADGAIVLMHDDTVDRTTNGKGRVAEMALAELQGLDAGYSFVDDSGRFPFRGTGVTVPSLAEILQRFPETRLNVEMKEFAPEDARALCALLRRHGALDRVLVSSFPGAPMAALRETCPEVATGATRREIVAFVLLNRLRLGSLFHTPAATLQVPLRYRGREVVTPALLGYARASNRPVQAWTVNDEGEMRQLLTMGVQAILTDRPDRLLVLMGRARRRVGRGEPGGPHRQQLVVQSSALSFEELTLKGRGRVRARPTSRLPTGAVPHFATRYPIGYNMGMNEVLLLRRRSGVTQSRLAELAGTSQPTIAAYESGRKAPNLRTLQKLAKAVGLEARMLFVSPTTREDRRSLALHEAIAERVVEDPHGVISRARRTLALMAEKHPGAAALLTEWDRLLRLPVFDLVEVLRDPRPRARELRQVTPFAAVLSAAERTAVYHRFEASEEAAS